MNTAYYEQNVGNEYSKSANAAEAEAAGRYSMTVAAKKLGISSRAFRVGCSSAKYKCHEWHHTGIYARRTDYYDTVALAASAEFWRGAASAYPPKAAAKLLAKHNVSPLTDAELAAAKEAATKEAIANVERFLATYGSKFVVQINFMDGRNGWRQKLRGNSAMSDLGLLSGYDYDNYGLPVLTREEAEAEVLRRAANPSTCFPGMQTRIVTVREDLLTSCPLYGRIAGKFTALGEARDFLK